MPFTEVYGVAALAQILCHFLPSVPQLQCLGVLEFALDDFRHDLVPRYALEHVEVVAFHVDLQEIDSVKVFISDDLRDRCEVHRRRGCMCIAESQKAGNARAFVGGKE